MACGGSFSVGAARRVVGEKALWPTTVIVCVTLLVIGALLYSGIDVVQIIAAFSIVGNVISLMLYNKVSKVEQNTNGLMTHDRATIRDLMDYVKNSSPTKKDGE